MLAGELGFSAQRVMAFLVGKRVLPAPSHALVGFVCRDATEIQRTATATSGSNTVRTGAPLPPYDVLSRPKRLQTDRRPYYSTPPFLRKQRH